MPDSEVKLNHLPTVPVDLPETMILTRLGFSKSKTKLTPEQQRQLQANMAHAFSLCRPRGIWTRLRIVKRDSQKVVLEDGTALESSNLSSMLENSSAVLLMAATVGPAIMDHIAVLIRDKQDGATALVYDAVGGQTADATLDWVNRYVKQALTRRRERLTSMRYSPGYGDLGLENQKLIFDILHLEGLGLSLTDRFLLIPEKSVIGICGIETLS